jgi:Methyltransferase domain.
MILGKLLIHADPQSGYISRAILQDRSMNRKNGFRYVFRRAWSWPGSVEEFVSTLLISPSLHVACGSSRVGDVRVDAFVNADVRGDMMHLPFRDCTFMSVLIDPPWHMPYHLRPKLAKELARVLRPDGVLVFNAPWRIRLRTLRLVDVFWADAPAWRNCPLVMVYRKLA